MKKPKNTPKKKRSSKSPEIHFKQADFVFRLEDKLSELQTAYEAGHYLAVLDALKLSLDLDCNPPKWVIEPAIDLISIAIRQGMTTGKGQTGNTLAKYRRDMEHFRRFSLVERLGEKMTLDEAYEQAEEELKGRFGEAKFEAIKKSYLRVRKRLADPSQKSPYYLGLAFGRQITGTDFSRSGPSKKKGKQ